MVQSRATDGIAMTSSTQHGTEPKLTKFQAVLPCAAGIAQIETASVAVAPRINNLDPSCFSPEPNANPNSSKPAPTRCHLPYNTRLPCASLKQEANQQGLWPV